MRIFLACHLYSEKRRVRCPLLIPLLGLMLSWEKVQMMVTFLSLQEDVKISQKSPFPPMGLCILPSSPAEEFRCFPPSLDLLAGIEAELACEYTLCAAEGQLQLPCGPRSDPGHRLPRQTPQGALGTPVSGLRSALVLHSSLQLQAPSDGFSLYRRVKAWSRTC